jgi:hypothetical protein
MTPEAVHHAEPTPAGMGTFSRLTGVFFEPGKTFEDIGRRPSWFVPLLVSILAALAFYSAYGQRVGWERAVRQQIATNARMAQQIEQIPADQRDAQIAMRAKFAGIGYYVVPLVITPIITLISAGILLGLTAMMSAGLRYKQVFAVVCFAGLPMVIKFLLSIVVVFLKNPDDFNLQNPLAFNIAAFMDPLTSSKFLYTFATAFDAFAIWVVILTAIGLSAAAGRKKLSFGGALFAVLVPWVVFVGFGATMASLFS